MYKITNHSFFKNYIKKCFYKDKNKNNNNKNNNNNIDKIYNNINKQDLIKNVLSNINIKDNIIKNALKNNSPIEEKLNIIVVISNPCLFIRRYQLFKEFICRLEKEESNINIFIVEMIYNNQEYMVTSSDNPNHLQLKTEIPLWHKENMINVAVKKLLPKDYKAFAWIDADIEFDSSTWVSDTLKLLNGTFDIVQLFSHCIFMDKDGSTLNNFNSNGYIHFNKILIKTVNDYSHPGYAWAITRELYEKIGYLFDKSILGGGDRIIINSIFNNINTFKKDYSKELFNSINNYSKELDFKYGYTPGIIKHYYHGERKNRQYTNRQLLYKKYNYNPNIHITYKNDILVPTDKFPKELINDIFKYFKERNEDE